MSIIYNIAKRRQGRDNLAPDELAHKIIEIAADKKGSDILLLDLRNISLLADYFVICTVETERQSKALSDAIIEGLKAFNSPPLAVEGVPSSGWVLIDCGSVIAHIFSPAQRHYYQLERLWGNAAVVVRIQ
jgi:ribosome-associated protein